MGLIWDSDSGTPYHKAIIGLYCVSPHSIVVSRITTLIKDPGLT